MFRLALGDALDVERMAEIHLPFFAFHLVQTLKDALLWHFFRIGILSAKKANKTSCTVPSIR
jgi:hypothetical protein